MRRVRQVWSERELGADDRADAGSQRGAMKAGRAVNAVTIEQRDRGISVVCCVIDQRFRKRGSFEKAEGGGGVELDIHDMTIDDWFD